jgi:hypothetical protein
MTETKLDSSISSSEFIDLNSYNVYRKDRTVFGGGVLLAVKNCYAPYFEIFHEDTDILCAKLLNPTHPTYVVVYYRRPNLTGFELLKTLMKKIKHSDAPLIILGDFNIPGIDWTSNTIKDDSRTTAIGTSFLHFLSKHNLTQHVKGSTHLKGNTLDLVLTRHYNPPEIDIIPGISDHQALSFSLSLFIGQKISNKRKEMKRLLDLKNADTQAVQQCLQELGVEIQRRVDDAATVDCVWGHFKNSIQQLIAINIPQKTITRQPKPWISRDIIHLVRRKRRAYKRYRNRTGSYSDYLKLDRLVKHKINKSKLQFINGYLCNQLEKGNSRPVYSYIASKRSTSKQPVCLKTTHNEFIDSPAEVAELFNLAFSKVFTLDDGVLPTPTNSQLPQGSDIQITTTGVEKLLTSLNPRKAIGPDGIPNIFLKTFAAQLAPIVNVIFRYSLNTGTVPNDWKMAIITPVHKSGPVTDPLNYRPIALTCVLSKLLEHIIATHLRHHLDNQSFFADEQHGFRSKRSCESQLIATTHSILEQVDKGNTVDAIILDFSKAFDTVCHQKLLLKLETLGIQPNITKWIKHWLTDRQQVVKTQGNLSPSIPVQSGVPQGSVLGPLLFIIYINDIVSCVTPPNSIRLFADDALLFGPVNPKDNGLQKDLDSLLQWANTWQMKFNAKKCNSISFGKQKNSVRYTLGLIPLQQTTSIKYLGINISSDLDWALQVNYVCNKSSCALGMLRRTLKGAEKATKLTMYKTLVRPILEYASSAWAPYRQAHIAELEKVQRKAVRWIANLKRDESVSEAMEALALDSLADRRQNKDTLLYMHMLEGRVDMNPDIYTPRNEKYSTRRNLIHLTTNTTTFTNSFFPRVIRSLTAPPKSTSQ